MVEAKYQVTGVGPTMTGRNGGGDLYYTDGEVWILRLVEACARRTGPAAVIAEPGGDRDQGPDLAGGGGQLAEVGNRRSIRERSVAHASDLARRSDRSEARMPRSSADASLDCFAALAMTDSIHYHHIPT